MRRIDGELAQSEPCHRRRADHDAVPRERREAVAADVSDEAADHRQGDHERDHEADRDQPVLAGVDIVGVLPQLQMESVLGKTDKTIVESERRDPVPAAARSAPAGAAGGDAADPPTRREGAEAMADVWENHKLTIIALVALVIAFFSSVIVVPETQQAVVIRTGEPVRTYNRFLPNVPFGQTNTGLRFRIPFFERVQMIDKRVLDLDMERQEVLSSDQQRLQVDAYARFRIIDPVSDGRERRHRGKRRSCSCSRSSARCCGRSSAGARSPRC